MNFLRKQTDFIIKDNLGDNGFKTENILEEIASINGTMQEDIPPGQIFISHLKVNIANDGHSGNYTCSAPNTKPTSTLVFITQGIIQTSISLNKFFST